MNNFDRRQLRYFVAVAEELHFGHAAKRLHISQPPLSQQIAALEKDIGVQLFARTKRKVEITAAGQQFLNDARLILTDMDKAASRARSVADGQTGTLHIGLNYSAPINPKLTGIFQRFGKFYPHVAIELHENTSAEQIAGLHRGTLDLCFIWANRDDKVPDIQLTSLGRNDMQLALSQEHPLARKRTITAADFRNQTFYLTLRQTRMAFYDKLVDMCWQHGFTPNIRTEVMQIPFIMNIVASSQAIGFIPDYFSRIRPETVVFRPGTFLPVHLRNMPLSLACRTGETSPLVQNFIKTAKNSTS